MTKDIFKDTNYEMNYDLELDNIINHINSRKTTFKKVLLQFPDGFKQYASLIVDELSKKTNAKFFIYFGTCFGACDTPNHLDNFGFDLCIQWGHCEFIKTEEMW